MPRKISASPGDLLRHVERAEREGQSLAMYARTHGLLPQALYNAKYAQRTRASAFVRVQVAAPVMPTPVAIRLPNGITVTTPMLGSLSALVQSLLPL